MIELSLIQKTILRINGRVSIGPKMKAGWRAPIIHYVARCPEHGVFIDYPHGYHGRLDCPECQKSAPTRTDEK